MTIILFQNISKSENFLRACEDYLCCVCCVRAACANFEVEVDVGVEVEPDKQNRITKTVNFQKPKFEKTRR